MTDLQLHDRYQNMVLDAVGLGVWGLDCKEKLRNMILTATHLDIEGLKAEW
jgi:hypothetical protein